MKLREAMLVFRDEPQNWGRLAESSFRSICGGLGSNSQYLFWLFCFWYFDLVCVSVFVGLWVAAGCDAELVTSMFEKLCCAWRNL